MALPAAPGPAGAPAPCTDFRSPPKLVPVRRPVGTNDCGMVAWLLTLRTPEYPQVRAPGTWDLGLGPCGRAAPVCPTPGRLDARSAVPLPLLFFARAWLT